MEPSDDPRRKDDPHDPFRGLFENLEEEMERMQEIFNEMFQRAMEAQGNLDEDPFVYGFTMRKGPDGNPVIDPFGNTSGMRPDARGDRHREPLTDVLTGPDEVSVTVELPGIEKDDIDLLVKEELVQLRVDTPERRYAKEIRLPHPVHPESAQATYKNGVLDLQLERQEREDEGHRVEVE